MNEQNEPFALEIKPSDLFYRYRRNKEERDEADFLGKPDPRPFDRNDLYQVLSMLEAVMVAIESRDGDVLHRVEEIMVQELPIFVCSREDVYDCLVAAMRGELGH
ncbi:MAG: hypothetical protein C0621_07895 [Desulfuromonas sp.]|nr:MAG: hypothetical protein C0621_07895 [Desulfuromonas sp.]